MVERLSVIDASLLQLDSAVTPLHVGGVAVFEPGLTFADVAFALEERLDEMPLARKRLQRVPLGGGRPVWVDDVDFDLSYHLRHAALPAPGDRAQLGDFVSRLISRPLDRTRPLWEMYVIEGLEGGRSAIFRKLHVAMTGHGGGDPYPLLLDDGAPRAAHGGAQRRWEPRTGPHRLGLAAAAARDRVEQATRLAAGLAHVASDPRNLVAAAAGAVGASANVALRALRQAPASPLNRPLTAHRRFATAAVNLDDLRRIRRAFGGTINDVVVAVTADAVGRLLRWRGYDTKDLDLTVMVPVRVHGDVGDAMTPTIGEGVVGVLAPLPVMEMDAVARLYRVRGEMADLKESRQAVAADSLVRVAGYGPPQLHALAARLVSARGRYNVALSNAPGPQEPRYLQGTRLEEGYPFIPLAGDSGLSVAVTSYAGTLFFGLLGDRDAMPDLDVLADLLLEGVEDLTEAARNSTGGTRA